MPEKDFKKKRESMVENQLKARGIADAKVLEVMKKVQREKFVPEDMISHAYDDEPLPIGEGQTISQPYIVSYMTEVLQIKNTDTVLEIGTGSGYQAAILAELAKEVFTVELIARLSLTAQRILKQQGYTNIRFKIGDGTQGWEDYAPYDAIVVTAAPPKVPEPLKSQLKRDGRMIIPVGETFQELVLVERKRKKFKCTNLLPVRFVPLICMH